LPLFHAFRTALATRKTQLSDAMRHRRVYQQTRRELAALSDRELADIGLCRLDIHEIAHDAAYGG